MSQEIFVMTGLGIGEETKGASAQWFTELMDAHTVWRSGGSQAGHHVVLEDGREQVFSHFGAGTFEGANTYLKHIVINPIDLFREGTELEKKGIEDPFGRIVISDDCLVATPFHGAMSRFREIMRGEDKKGTIGKGVGEVVKDSEFTELAVRAGEFLGDRDSLLQKVEAIRQHKVAQVITLLRQEGVEELSEEAIAELRVIYNHSLVEKIVDSFQYLGDLVRIVGDDYLDELLERDGAIVCEPSHGALLHPRQGFVPHVTQIDPSSQDVLSTLKEHEYKGRIIRIGVSRSYMTRHGAGPLVSYSEEMSQAIQETHNNAAHEWLGEFRNGHYDILAMRYAIEVAGGKDSFDGLKISYLDALKDRGEWVICEGYTFIGDADDIDAYFKRDGDKIVGIKYQVDSGGDDHYQRQLRLTSLLKQCEPVLSVLRATRDHSLEEVFLDYVQEQLDIPVVAVARGPRKEDREVRPGWEDLLQSKRKNTREVPLE